MFYIFAEEGLNEPQLFWFIKETDSGNLFGLFSQSVMRLQKI